MNCYICGSNAIALHGRKNLCGKHKRFIQMQATARNDKKYSPSIYEIESLVPKDMSCQDCGITMHWIDNEKRSSGAVLQHYRDGTLGIICMSCNTKHGLMPGDSYREVPTGHKLCRCCKTIKPLSMFSLRRDGKVPYPLTKCKSCMANALKLWRTKNPDAYKAITKKHNDAKRKKNAAINSV